MKLSRYREIGTQIRRGNNFMVRKGAKNYISEDDIEQALL